MDIGTTTVQARLIDLNSGAIKAQGADFNAQFCSLNNAMRKEIVELSAGITNFELSETHSNMDHYVAALFLPHTDLNRFPRLKARLGPRKNANLTH